MVISTAGVPARGDVVIIDFNPQLGSEQAGRRPALVLSPSAYNGTVGLAIVCPVTNQVKGFPFEVAIPAGMEVTGVILADHVKSLDWRVRNARVVCQLPQATVADVLETLLTLIGEATR
jgi:mRNA interferase MazF